MTHDLDGGGREDGLAAMTQDPIASIAGKLTKAQREWLLAMTEEWQLPGLKTFNANAAFNLSWVARKTNPIVVSQIQEKRSAYRLTPLGVEVRAFLERQSHGQE